MRRLSDIVYNQHPLTLPSNATVKHACECMRERGRTGHAQEPRWIDGLLEGRFGFVDRIEDPPEVCVVALALRRQKKLARGTVQQSGLQVLFQRRHIATDVGLPQAQIAPGRREAAGLHGAGEACHQEKSVQSASADSCFHCMKHIQMSDLIECSA